MSISAGEELTFDKLKNRFPNILKGIRYMSIGKGWFGLIHDMLLALEALKLDEYPNIDQVKEKFGGLRWYAEHYIQEYQDIVNKYEDLSFEVCITCGNIEDVQLVGSWVQPLCVDCRKEIK